MSDRVQRERFGEFVSIERRGRITVVTYDRGDALNALSIKGMTELRDVATFLAGDNECTVIVLHGPAVFSAGADLRDRDRQDRKSASLLEQRSALRLGPDMCQAWADLEQVTIAAIEGFCIGGGLALAASCDHRISSRAAHFRLPEIPLGMNMSWRAVPRLVALLGPSRAKQLIIQGRKVSAETALSWGLVDELAETGDALRAALDTAAIYAALPPLAVRMSKQAIDTSAHALSFATSFMDRDQFLLAAMSSDQTEAIQAFLEKRDAKFTGD